MVSRGHKFGIEQKPTCHCPLPARTAVPCADCRTVVQFLSSIFRFFFFTLENINFKKNTKWCHRGIKLVWDESPHTNAPHQHGRRS